MHSPSFAIPQNLFDSFGIRQKNVGRTMRLVPTSWIHPKGPLWGCLREGNSAQTVAVPQTP